MEFCAERGKDEAHLFKCSQCQMELLMANENTVKNLRALVDPSLTLKAVMEGLNFRILGEATGVNLRIYSLFWGYLFLLLLLLNSTSVILYGKTRSGVIGVRSLLVRSWWTLWPTMVSYRQCCQTGMQVLNLWFRVSWCTPSTTGCSSAETASQKECFLSLENIVLSAWVWFWPVVSVQCDDLNLAPVGNGN